MKQDSLKKHLHEKNNPLAFAFISTFRYINDVLSINNDQFHSYIDSIYPNELKSKRHHRIIYFCFILGWFVKHICWQTDRQVDVAGNSTISFDVSVSEVLWPLECSNLTLQTFIEPYVV
jgi:hypothetical protein